MSAANDVRGLLATIGEFLPRLVGAVVVLLAALILALILQRLAGRILDSLGLDALFERTGASETLWKVGYSGGPSRILGLAVFWGTLLTGIRRLPERTRPRLAGERHQPTRQHLRGGR